MHPEAYECGQKFVDKYLRGKSDLKVLDIGSYDVNGSLKPLFNVPGWEYTGLDIAAGPNVDVVLKTPNQFPFWSNKFDVIISSSCFEHDHAFWKTFSEMVRVTKNGGHIYIHAPSIGPYHGYPSDCWRFYRDSYKALAEVTPGAVLVEQYIDQTSLEWKDNVGIFRVEKTSLEIDPMKPVSESPFRSPMAVSEAVRSVINGKVVCELGCSSGDNIVFMSRYAKRVMGLEYDDQKVQIAQSRGLDVVKGDYFKDSIPEADVYYFWPDDGAKDNVRLLDQLLAQPGFNGTVIIGGDTGFPPEIPSVRACGERGTLIEVPFNEGPGPRQSGTFLLAIVRA